MFANIKTSAKKRILSTKKEIQKQDFFKWIFTAFPVTKLKTFHDRLQGNCKNFFLKKEFHGYIA